MKLDHKSANTIVSMVAVMLFLATLASPPLVQAGKPQPPACVVPNPVPTGGYCFSGAPGCLDTSFGGGSGRVMFPPGMTVKGIAIQNVAGDPRIVAVGSTSDPCFRNPSQDWIVARYYLDGRPDTTFGVGGIIKGGYSGGQATANAVVVQLDNHQNKLVIGGSTPSGNQSYVPAVVRYNENGTLDTSFAPNGVINVPYGKHGGWVDAIALQDGKIVASGCSAYPCRLTVFRLAPLPKGGWGLDTTFNGTGQYVYTDYPSEGRALALQTVASGAKIVVAGYVYHDYNRALLFRFNSADGTPDSSFGSLGIVMEDFTGYNAGYYGLAVDSSNRLVAVGQAMARYNETGQLDDGFGDHGKVIRSDGLGAAIAIQSDGYILVTGSGQGMVNWRFAPNGSLDSLFGNQGFVNECFTNYCSASSNALVLLDGKFVAAGFTTTTDGVNKYGYAALACVWR